MQQVKKRRSIAGSIALALCCSLVSSPVWAKTFVGVLYPLFGPMAAIGLVDMANELKAMPDVEVATYLHQSWRSLVGDNNAISVSNNVSYVDEIIALQPSMLTSQDTLTGTVGKIIEIYNPNRWMTFGGMGSQKLDAPNIEYVVNNDTHPGAQFNAEFRNIVRNELTRVAALDTAKLAQAKTPLRSTASTTNVANIASTAKPTKPAKLEVAKRDRPEHQLTTQASALPAVFSTSLNSDTVKQEQPEHQLRVLAAFPEPLSSSAKADNALVQRTLTIVDMKEYVKRNYPTSPPADLTR